MSQSAPSFGEFVSTNMTTIITVAIFTAAGFFLGSLWTENQLLKSGVSTNTAGVVTDPSLQLPPGPTMEERLASFVELDDTDRSVGNPDTAKVVLIEYSDLNCIWCKRFHYTMKRAVEEFGSDVAWVYRHLPFQGSQTQSQIAECVGQVSGNEKYFEFLDGYFETISTTAQSQDVEAAYELASEIGVNRDAVEECVDAGESSSIISAHMSGATGMAISGTPATVVVVDGKPVNIIDGAIGANPNGGEPTDEQFAAFAAQIEQYL